MLQVFKDLYWKWQEKDVPAQRIYQFMSYDVRKQMYTINMIKEKLEDQNDTGKCGGNDDLLGFIDLPVDTQTHIVPYVPRFIGNTQGAKLVESEQMASVKYPRFDYMPYIPKEMLDPSTTTLSGPQLELVYNAGYMHNKWKGVETPTRQSFIVADSMGVGKGRACAAIILDNFYQYLNGGNPLTGQAKSIWFSASSGLHDSIQRDFDDVLSCVSPNDLLHASRIGRYPVKALNTLKQTDKITDNCCLYCTYNMLISSSAAYHSRFQQIEAFLRDGASNKADCHPVIIFDEIHKANNASENASQMATRVMQLQHNFPNAKVLYVSATPTSQSIEKLRTFERIGLWGEGTPFGSFEEFQSSFFGNKHQDHTDLMELLAINLKLSGRLYCRMLPPNYNCDTLTLPLTESQRDIYNDVCIILQNMRRMVEIHMSSLKRQFEGNALQIYELLLSSFKATNIIPWITQSVLDGYSVVIGLQGTGESRQKKAIKIHGNQIPHNTGGCLDLLITWINKIRERDSDFGNTIPDAFYDALPSHALDILANGLVDNSINFSEITGRKSRYMEYLNAFESRGNTEFTNNLERQKFMAGENNVLILSSCQNEGISLHSTEYNKRVRRHCCLEIADNATSQFQQFGRTDRNGQWKPPEYYIVMTDVPGEYRFISDMIRKFKKMGALIRGNRNLGGPLNTSLQYDWQSKNSEKAILDMIEDSNLRITYLQDNKDITEHPKILLRSVGITKDNVSCKLFFNRLLGMSYKTQHELFCLAERKLKQCMAREWMLGKASTDIIGESVTIINRENIYEYQIDNESISSTNLTIVVDTGCKYSTVSALPGEYWKHKRNNSIIKVSESDSNIGACFSPQTYPNSKKEWIRFEKVKSLYDKIEDSSIAEKLWNIEYEQIPNTTINLLTGSLICIWKQIRVSCTSIKEAKLKQDNAIYIGIILSTDEIDTLKKELIKKPVHECKSEETWWSKKNGSQPDFSLSGRYDGCNPKKSPLNWNIRKTPLDTLLSTCYSEFKIKETNIGNILGVLHQPSETELFDIRLKCIQDKHIPLTCLPIEIRHIESMLAPFEPQPKLSISIQQEKKGDATYPIKNWRSNAGLLTVNMAQEITSRKIKIKVIKNEDISQLLNALTKRFDIADSQNSTNSNIKLKRKREEDVENSSVSKEDTSKSTEQIDNPDCQLNSDDDVSDEDVTLVFADREEDNNDNDTKISESHISDDDTNELLYLIG